MEPNPAQEEDYITLLQSFLTPDELRAVAEGLLLLRTYWGGSERGFGELNIRFDPKKTVVTPSPDRSIRLPGD